MACALLFPEGNRRRLGILPTSPTRVVVRPATKQFAAEDDARDDMPWKPLCMTSAELSRWGGSIRVWSTNLSNSLRRKISVTTLVEDVPHLRPSLNPEQRALRLPLGNFATRVRSGQVAAASVSPESV